MLNVQIPQHDFGYREQFTIYSDGRLLYPKDLTDMTATLYAWDSTTADNPVISRELQIADDPTSGVVYWNVQQEDTAVFGNFNAEIKLSQTQTVDGQETAVMAYSTMQFNLQIIPSWQGGQA